RGSTTQPVSCSLRSRGELRPPAQAMSLRWRHSKLEREPESELADPLFGLAGVTREGRGLQERARVLHVAGGRADEEAGRTARADGERRVDRVEQVEHLGVDLDVHAA